MAGQDYPKRLEAGATQNVNIGGDYIFCKFADRPFTVIMDGSRVTMESGDKYRNEGGFKEFEIENTDTLNPIAIVLTIGQGDYNRQIIKGEITTVTGVRRADGRFEDDTRQTLQMNITPIYNYVGETIAVGDALNSLEIVDIPGTVYERSSFGDLKYYNGALLVRLKGFLGNENDLISIDLGLGTFNRVALPNDWFNDDDITRFAVCEELPGGFAVNNLYSTKRDRVRYYDSALDTLVEFLSVGYDIDWLEFRNDTKELFVGGYDFPVGIRVKVYNLSGTTATFNREVNLTEKNISSNNAFFNRDSLIWTHCKNAKGNGNNIVTTDENFNIIQVYDIDAAGGGSQSGGSTNYNVLVGEVFYGWGDGYGLFYETAAVQSDLSLRGFASAVGCEIINLDPQYDNFATRADVSLTNEFGRVKVQGELIKAALELYYRNFLDVGYMDHVFDVTVYNPTNGSVLQSIGGRSVTLSRLGVVDDFSGYFPSRIDITVDAGLPLI
jgi:hypothetical protein